LFVAAEGPIKSASDLAGRKVGIVAVNDTSYRAVLYVNKRPSIKAEPVALGSLANNIAALKSGQIDAFYSAEGTALTRIGPGELRVLVPLSDLYPRPYTAVVVWASEDLIAENPDLVKRFVAATLEAAQYLKDAPRLRQRSLRRAKERPEDPRRPGSGPAGAIPLAGWSWQRRRPGRCCGRQLEIHDRIGCRVVRHGGQYRRCGRRPILAEPVKRNQSATDRPER
jgi:hypothetical protein